VFGSPFKLTVLPPSVTESAGGGSALSLGRASERVDMDATRAVTQEETTTRRETTGVSTIHCVPIKQIATPFPSLSRAAEWPLKSC